MAAKNTGARKCDSRWHANLLSELGGMLTNDEVRKLKQYIGISQILTRSELAECTDFHTLWDMLEQAGNLAVNEYDDLSEMMEMLKRRDCVGLINAHKEKIEDYRTKHKAQASQSEEPTIDDAIGKLNLLQIIGPVIDKKFEEFLAREPPSQKQKSPGEDDAVPTPPSQKQTPLRRDVALPTTTCTEKSLLGAATNGDTAVVRRLLSEGADANECDEDDSWTALMAASQYGHTDVVDALLKGGAEIDKETKFGQTALMLASYHGHADAVEVLLKAGATIDKMSKDGYSALTWAEEKGHTEVVALLKQYGAKR